MYEECFERNKGALKAIAWHYRGWCEKDPAVSIEDLVQAAFIGLMMAYRTYDKSSGKSWALHKRAHITAEVYAALGIRNGEKRSIHAMTISLDAPVFDEADGETVRDMLEDDRLGEIDGALLREETRREVRASISRLADPRQRRLLTLHGLEGMPMEMAADALGVSVHYARQIYNRGLAKLARDCRMRAAADLDEETLFLRHKGVTAVLRSRTSVTEEAAMWRIDQRDRRRDLRCCTEVD